MARTKDSSLTLEAAATNIKSKRASYARQVRLALTPRVRIPTPKVTGYGPIPPVIYSMVRLAHLTPLGGAFRSVMDQPGGLKGSENIFIQAWRRNTTFDLSEDSVLRAGIILPKGREKVTDDHAHQRYCSRMTEKKKMAERKEMAEEKKMVGEQAADARKSEGAGCAE